MHLVPLDQPRQLLFLRELWGSSMTDANLPDDVAEDWPERIERILDSNAQRLVSAERLSVVVLCEIAQHLARLADLYEFELGLDEEEEEEEEDLEALARPSASEFNKLEPADLDEINKLPPAEADR